MTPKGKNYSVKLQKYFFATEPKILPINVGIRQIKYLNNIIEQDHRSIKRLVNPMLGFQSFQSANKTLKGIEAMNMIKKDKLIL